MRNVKSNMGPRKPFVTFWSRTTTDPGRGRTGVCTVNGKITVSSKHHFQPESKNNRTKKILSPAPAWSCSLFTRTALVPPVPSPSFVHSCFSWATVILLGSGMEQSPPLVAAAFLFAARGMLYQCLKQRSQLHHFKFHALTLPVHV